MTGECRKCFGRQLWGNCEAPPGPGARGHGGQGRTVGALRILARVHHGPENPTCAILSWQGCPDLVKLKGPGA